MKSRRIHLSVFLALSVSYSAFAEEGTSIKQDVKGAAHAIKREWKKGWKATKKTAKEIGKGAADATEKGAKKVKQKLAD